MLQQRAKMQWMKDGDQCSRVFFRKIAQRRVRRRILQVNDENGFTHTDLGEIAHEFVSYYQNLLGGTRRRLSVDIRYLRPWARHCITDEEANQLLLPISADDVKQAMFDIADDKAPGPDGYSSRFFKAAWPVVGEEVTRAVLDFFSTGKLLKQVNSTILALIPKVHTPMSVNDFRPISCCNVLYKIIAKLLVQKISVLLDKIVSPCQTAFIPGRSIGDNIMLAQELFSRYNQMRLPPRCALKVDIRKAYDTVEWDFLLAVLQLFGFPPTFTRWIEECVTTTSFSIGLNGKPHGFFTGARGLRQGDPLSPYLFVLVMEALHLGFLQRIEQDMQFTYHWKCESSKVFQMGFADDLLLLCKADLDSIRVFKEGLDWFAELSGLRLNVQKSHLIISRSAQNLKDQMLDFLGFHEGHLPMRYLGLPLISSRLTISDCQPLISKIDARINGWEGISLSYAGRVQIIKSVLSALSLYWASAFILPKKVISEIEKRLRTFLWKGTTSSGYAKVAWKDVCRPMDEGGLGFKDISTLNRALMSKKLCDVIQCDRTSIWVQWLYQDRLRERSIWTIREHGGSWGWRKILRLRPFLRTIVDYQIGNGDRFFVWQDPWHHLGPLIERFPQGPRHLRLEESAKLSLVISAGEWQWPTITDFECLEITHNLPLIFGGEDRVVWRCDEGQPTTQALYRLFTHPEPKVGWSSLLLGSLKIPRHSFILWLAILGKLPTTDKSWLSHLGVCILCDEGATESHPHLFFQCRFSRQCLYEIRRRIRFHWPNRDWATDIEWATRKWRGEHIINRAYRTLLAACVYHIWKERNLRRFDHTERTPATLSILIINDVRQRILSVDLASSVSTRALYRLWRIPWVEGETNCDYVSVMEDGRMRSEKSATMEALNLGFLETEKTHVEKAKETDGFPTIDEFSGVVRDGGDVPLRKDPSLPSVEGCVELGFGGGDLKRAVNGGCDDSSSPANFNIDEFITLANRVMDGDTNSIAVLNDLSQNPLGEEIRPSYFTKNKSGAANCSARKETGERVNPPAINTENMNNGAATLSPEFSFVSGDRTATEVLGRRKDVFPATSPVNRPGETSGDVATVLDDVAPRVYEVDADVAYEVIADVIDDVPIRADVTDDVIAEVNADVNADGNADVTADINANVIADVTAEVTTDVLKKNPKFQKMGINPKGLFVGNIPLHTNPEDLFDDKIVHAFNNSTRKTLSFIAPTLQNGEVIVRPTLDIIRNGSKRWRTTAVGYFLGKRPYFHHVKEFAMSIWSDLTEDTATTNGFFFFQFKTVIAMEDVIEGGPWLFQGQPIVLQKWEPGMALRKLKHTQVPVWIKLRHLPMELWTEEGLSIVASGVGKPLYPDAITRACMRLDFARVCVMLDATSNLPKHIIIMTPNEDGGESPCKIDVEYEWLPTRCNTCMTLGHTPKECAQNKTAKSIKTPVAVYVPKVKAPRAQVVSESKKEAMPNRGKEVLAVQRREKHTVIRDTPSLEVGPSREERGKALVIYNSFDALQLFDDTEGSSRGPKPCSPRKGDPC
ncbi:UNVERIFIED_CONTAM: hypothetical protein Sindi_2546000 [Sesamum indicum]